MEFNEEQTKAYNFQPIKQRVGYAIFTFSILIGGAIIYLVFR